MMPSGTVTFTTPDGVERPLRFTLGARKRIAERFGEASLLNVMNRFGDGALPEIIYSMMFDANGDPPPDLDVREFAEALDDGTPLLAAIMSAIGKGAVPKNELEALLRKQMEMEAQKQIGARSGPSRGSASGSLPPNSGTVPTENSTPSPNDSTTENEASITAPA